MTLLNTLICEGPTGCQSLGEAMQSVATVAVFWILVMVVVTIVGSTALYVYHGGDWPKGGST